LACWKRRKTSGVTGVSSAAGMASTGPTSTKISRLRACCGRFEDIDAACFIARTASRPALVLWPITTDRTLTASRRFRGTPEVRGPMPTAGGDANDPTRQLAAIGATNSAHPAELLCSVSHVIEQSYHQCS